MAMTTLSPSQIADRWAAGLSAAGPKIQAGVQAVTVSPTAKAAQAVDRQVAGVQAAAASGKTAAALNAVSLPQWQQAFITKGLPRIASGATAAKPAFANFMTQFLPAVQSAVNSLPPRGDLETNIARQNQLTRALANFKYRKQ